MEWASDTQIWAAEAPLPPARDKTNDPGEPSGDVVAKGIPIAWSSKGAALRDCPNRYFDAVARFAASLTIL